MDKYSEVQAAVKDLEDMINVPLETIKNYDSGYTMDAIVYKKESLPMQKEIVEIVHDQGSIGVIEGVSSVWASARGKVVIWNYKTQMVSEMEIKSQEVQAIFAVKSNKYVFTSNVQNCILVFTENSIDMLCLCKNPASYISMDVSVSLPVKMTCVCETSEGRVFMGGADGNIYEYVYRERTWLKGCTAKLVSRTHGAMTHLLPFLYAMGSRPAILQMVATRKGLLVLFKDNTLEAYELGAHLRKIRNADLPELNTKEKIQLVKGDDGACQAYLVLPDATRVFIDENGYMLGKRKMTPTRIRSRLVAPSSIKNEVFHRIGRTLVSIGQKESEMFITVITANKADPIASENCCSVVAGAEYMCAAATGGKPWKNLAEEMFTGEEVVFLAPNRLDIYHIMNGVELMERASTNPEGMFAFMQRNGPEQALVSALYAVAGGASSPAIDSFFKKSEGLQKSAAIMCASMIVFKVWQIDIYALLKDESDIDIGDYVDELEQAAKKAKRLKNFVVRECTNINNIRISEDTVIDLLENAAETLNYIIILLESDALYIFDEAQKNSDAELKFTFCEFLKPVTHLRRLTLNALVDLNLRQKASIDSVTTDLNEKCSTLFALADTLLLKGKEAIEKASRASTEEDRKWHLIKSMEFFTKAAAKQYLPEIVQMYSKVNFSKGILYAIRSGFNSISEKEATEYFKQIECTEEILQEGLKDERPALCNALLNAAIAKIEEGRLSIDVLLKIKSPYLEDYLDRLDRMSETMSMCDLTWKYHLKNENYSAAALYLMRSAERAKPVINLQKRIEYLSIAKTMQAAVRCGEEPLLTGQIRNYSPRLGKNAKDRLAMAQMQADVMGCLVSMYTSEGGEFVQNSTVEETFVKLDTTLLGFEELFEICVMFGFSVLALKIAARGEIEDARLMKALWEDALSGPYEKSVQMIKSNPDIIKGAPIDMLFDMLIKKKADAPQKGENIGSALVSFGNSVMKVASLLEKKAASPEHSAPSSKRIIFEEAVVFCEMHNLTDIAHRMNSFRMSLGL
ncbi:uncharacterized protein NEMAJ01_0298 [Nematocida major]|uniref:uncharacterized protein n=1 Tax=Nematocida major TaxID=1912982 RepID=UPI00200761D3|nr:uncharacterized protein NEMAJ01_0298 [Nematocida major]KAH9385402.1 hypothetical protein NEMAJ01_0298 [Nematocida major]